MDESRFDALARMLSSKAGGRRQTLGILAGWAMAAIGRGPEGTRGKKRKKNRKKKKVQTPQPLPPSPCVPDCRGKKCGSDGCGGTCGSCQQAESCVSGQCTSASCSPACPANQVCQGGVCGCPAGMKECPNQGPPGSCHECCVTTATFPDPECASSPNGNYCVDPNGNQLYRCGCYIGLKNCGDGKCVPCCTHQDCINLTGDQHRLCLSGACLCNETDGFVECPDPSFHVGECRHIADDSDACGPLCKRCDPPNSVCAGGACCFPSGASCVNNSRGCCAGENACGPGFICH